MIVLEQHSKVTPDHLKRNAYLYIRQSTMRQVLENTESTKRQYALRQKGIALGWPTEQIIVIDIDQGQSGAQAADREGFQQLVTEVSLGHAGIVMGLEVSRLARNSMDWHRLLEICALTRTLILDEEGVYDPSHFNDRLLLGLKGTMSEAELHVLQARLRGGVINKAKRGELRIALPIGLIYDMQERIIRDPDQQIQQCLNLFFNTFRQVGSACGVLKLFRQEKLLFPRRIRSGINKGDVVWGELTHARALQTLHNPRYAGAFVFGRTQTTRQLDGGYRYKKIDKEQWQIVIKNLHEGYITWEEFENNLQRLRNNTQAFSSDRPKTPPREGCALLQGLVICGRCGQRMTVRYHTQKGQLIPDYACQRDGINHARTFCQVIRGGMLDQLIGNLLVEMITPASMEVALAIQQEIELRFAEILQAHQQRVESARYEAELAKRRYCQVDPDNRLVASTLEAEWNAKLRLLEQAQLDYNDQQQQKEHQFSEKQKQAVLALADDFPKIWCSPNTLYQERKRIMRLLIEDVTLYQETQIVVQIRFKGGTTKTITLPRPKSATELFVTNPDVVAEVDRLLDNYTDSQIALKLNESGLVSGRGIAFTDKSIKCIRRTYSLKSQRDRLREKGFITAMEIAKLVGISATTVHQWRREDRLIGCMYNDRGDYLYKPVNKDQIKALKKMRYEHKGNKISFQLTSRGAV